MVSDSNCCIAVPSSGQLILKSDSSAFVFFFFCEQQMVNIRLAVVQESDQNAGILGEGYAQNTHNF